MGKNWDNARPAPILPIFKLLFVFGVIEPTSVDPPALKFSFFFDLIPYPFVGHFVTE